MVTFDKENPLLSHLCLFTTKQVNMMTLAEHIIEATPERIKRENFTAADSVPLDTSGVSNTMNWLANYLGDVEQLPSIIHLR